MQQGGDTVTGVAVGVWTGEPTRLAILGSTGSIGTQTLEVIEAQPGRFSVVALAARGGRIDLLNEQIRRFRPLIVAIEDDADRGAVEFPADRVLSGADGLLALATLPEADLVVVATSGHAAIRPTLAAIEAGKELALANKETIVCAGPIVVAAARERGITIRPIDSEHSALWQCLQGSPGPESVGRLIITGSGGPFRGLTADELAAVTPQGALKHPTWPTMGGKITIDSATLMNKGLEVIEARWLFDLPFERIEVVIHPQSIVHSLVEFADGAVLAQLGLPDMRLPIAYALTYPERPPLPFPRLDLLRAGRLDFEAPDRDRFPCLRLAYEAGQAGGLLPTILSAADEEAVAAFLRGDLPFTGIPRLIEAAMDAYAGSQEVTLEAIEEVDRWARIEARDLVARRAFD
jgi:1-deoxy-D-xylulose-5-phosphate reductoisomerase